MKSSHLHLSSQSPAQTTSNSKFVEPVNALQMRFSNAYINGLELPDNLVLNILKSGTYLLYTRFPNLLIAYPWVVKESEQLVESSDELMKIQYNLPSRLFELMIGESWNILPKYTMALWEKGATNLEQAQINMLDDAINKLGIQDSDNILDLGCGWGSAVEYILRKFPNATATGLDLSSSHCDYLRRKMRDPESVLSSGRFTLCQGNFNNVTFPEKFDKIITLGFFEHVGNFTKAFKKMATYLKPGGRAFLHIISSRLTHNIWSPFMNTYIFPKARIWHYDAVPLHNQSLKTTQQWYMNGNNYAQTLRCWLKNFDKYQDDISSLNYGIEYPKFRRLWRLYLLWCIAYFETCDGTILGNGQYLMEHR